MIFVNVGDLLSFDFLKAASFDMPIRDVVRKAEPNRLVFIFQKLAVHPDYLDVVQFGNVVRNLCALFLTVDLLVALDQVHIVAQTPVVIHNLLVRIL